MTVKPTHQKNSKAPKQVNDDPPADQERYFIAYSPAPSSQLWKLGAAWFGFDATTGESPKKTLTLGLPPEIHNQAVASARRTGFNAILMAPFTLRSDANEATLCKSLQTFCKSLAPFRTCRVKINATNLSDDCVHYFNIFREVKTQLPLNSRIKEALSERQIENFVSWGYPYYFDDYKFTIPITGRVPAAMANPMAQQLQTIFSPALGQGLMVDGISLFKQSSNKEPARLIKRTPFRMNNPTMPEPSSPGSSKNHEKNAVTSVNI